MYILSWRTVSALTWVLFWYLFPSLLHNSGNKHQNNPLVSAETIRHSSTYIILYIFWTQQSNIRVVLCVHPANKRQHYKVMSSLTGWVHAQNDPCNINSLSTLWELYPYFGWCFENMSVLKDFTVYFLTHYFMYYHTKESQFYRYCFCFQITTNCQLSKQSPIKECWFANRNQRDMSIYFIIINKEIFLHTGKA